MIRVLLRFIFKALYKVEVKDLENYEQAGDGVLMVANHLSFLDAMLKNVRNVRYH